MSPPHREWPALALLSLVSLGVGERPPSAVLGREIDRVVGRADFSPAVWGIEVRDLETGVILYSRNAEKSLQPASLLKLVTTAAALDALGPAERILTSLEAAAPLDGQGSIQGDVFLVGRGDPNLSGRFAGEKATAPFEELADALRIAGVRRIEGRIVGHEGLFQGDRRRPGWAWEDLVWWYGAEVSALSFNDNCADLKVQTGQRVGDPLIVHSNPDSSYYRVVSTALTGPPGSKSDLTLNRDLGANLIRLSGSHPLGEPPAELNVALEDPARYAATVFAEVLESRGISVAGGAASSSDPLPAGIRVLATHSSPSLSEMLKAVNKTSQNLHAEMLLRLLGARLKGEGTAEAGLEVVRAFLARLAVDTAGWDLQDGSGLSAYDLVTPHGLVELLVAMDRHPHAEAFKASLPVAGVDGSLRNRMKGTPAEGRVIAKTGGVNHTVTRAGYATRKKGGRLAFAILVNHVTSPPRAVPTALDEICEALVGR